MNLAARFPAVSGAANRKPFAVVDIGSNSVRMVVYESLKRAALPIFNEKVLCGLGRGVRENGRLDPEAAEVALHTLRRYAALAEAMGVGALEAVATAAIRDSADGMAFVARVSDQCGIDVRVLTGNEEGYYSALGVAAAIPSAHGVVGDLGGGSLELVGMRASSGAPRPSSRPSLPLPPSRAVAAPRASRRVAADVDVIITAFRSVARSQAPSRRRRRPRVRVRVRVRVAPSRPRDVAAVPTPGRRPRGPARGAAGRDDPPRVRRRARGRQVRSPYTGPHTIPSA